MPVFESSIRGAKDHHIVPVAALTGLVWNPPPLWSVAVRKKVSGWSPLPLSSSPDFPALNGVLHYTRCSRSSPVQGLSCIKADTAQSDTPLWTLLVNFASCTVCQKLPLCNSIRALFRHVKAALLTFSGPLEAELIVLQTRSLDKL